MRKNNNVKIQFKEINFFFNKKNIIFADTDFEQKRKKQILMKKIMEKTKKTGNGAVEASVSEERKSRIALFLENKPNIGTIVNMRAVLK